MGDSNTGFEHKEPMKGINVAFIFRIRYPVSGTGSPTPTTLSLSLSLSFSISLVLPFISLFLYFHSYFPSPFPCSHLFLFSLFLPSHYLPFPFHSLLLQPSSPISRPISLTTPSLPPFSLPSISLNTLYHSLQQHSRFSPLLPFFHPHHPNTDSPFPLFPFPPSLHYASLPHHSDQQLS